MSWGMSGGAPAGGPWAVAGPGMAGQGMVPAGYTAEQWAVAQQQNWQQWAQWQQQYAQWQTQYGDKFAQQMQMQAMSGGGVPPLPNSVPAAVPAPPPPASTAPPQPPPPPHENNQPLYHGHNQHQPTATTNAIPPTIVPVPAAHSAVNADALKKLAEEERLFDIQFQKWEEEIEKWKRENVNHPDKQAYREYEQKFEACRAQLMERRRQMDARKAKLQGSAGPPAGPMPAAAPPTPQQQPVPPTAPANNVPITPMNNYQNRPQFHHSQNHPNANQNQPPQNFPPGNPSLQNFAGNSPAQNFQQQGNPPAQNFQQQGNQPRNYREPVPNNFQPKQQHNQAEPMQQFNRQDLKNADPQDRYEAYGGMEDYSEDSGSFLPTGAGAKGIPGLDLVPTRDKLASNQQPPVIDITDDGPPPRAQAPDLSTISQGINNILGDEKIMNILSMVRGQGPPNDQNMPQNRNMLPGNNVPRTGNNMPPNGQNMPPSGHNMPPSGQNMPPRGHNMPPSGPIHNMPPGGHNMPLNNRNTGGHNMPPNNQNMPPGGHNMPPGGHNMPPGGHNMPPGGHNMPPGGHNMPPNNQNMPPGGHSMPPGGHNMPPNNHNMPPGGQNNQNQWDRKYDNGPGNQNMSFNRQSNEPVANNQRMYEDRANSQQEYYNNQYDDQGPPRPMGPRPLMEQGFSRRPDAGPGTQPKQKWIEEPMFAPSIIVDYEHKPLRLKARDFIEPVHMFDYNHISKEEEYKDKDFEKEAEDLFVRKPRRGEAEDRLGIGGGRAQYYRETERDFERRPQREILDEPYARRVPEPIEDRRKESRDSRWEERREPRVEERRESRWEEKIDSRFEDPYRREEPRAEVTRREEPKRDDYTRRDGHRREEHRREDYSRRDDYRRDDYRRDDYARRDDYSRREEHRERERSHEHSASAGRSHSRSMSIDSRKRPSSRERDDPKRAKDAAEANSEPKHVVMIDDLLEPPGRDMRPEKIVIIMRGPPGSGKSYLSRLIRDREAALGGTARIMSIDDYFMQESELEQRDPLTGNMTKKPTLKYEYDPKLEETYLNSLKRAFKRSITDGYFNFIIYDAVNDQLKSYADIWNFARQNNFQVYVCTLELDATTCHARNIHDRSLDDIQVIVARWFPTPAHHLQLDATSLLQSAAIQDVTMEDAYDDEEEVQEVEHSFTSKWETMDDARQLARLDGTSRPLRPALSMTDYLQLDDDWQPTQHTKPGKKTVRWADIEERREQQRMRELGFVVGRTDWDRITDHTRADHALNRTKYIERVRKY